MASQPNQERHPSAQMQAPHTEATLLSIDRENPSLLTKFVLFASLFVKPRIDDYPLFLYEEASTPPVRSKEHKSCANPYLPKLKVLPYHYTEKSLITAQMASPNR